MPFHTAEKRAAARKRRESGFGTAGQRSQMAVLAADERQNQQAKSKVGFSLRERVERAIAKGKKKRKKNN